MNQKTTYFILVGVIIVLAGAIGYLKWYETIYEYNDAQPTSGGNVLADERVVHELSYAIEVDTDMEPGFDGDVIQFDGVSMTIVS